jgi:hypothetical protein
MSWIREKVSKKTGKVYRSEVQSYRVLGERYPRQRHIRSLTERPGERAADHAMEKLDAFQKATSCCGFFIRSERRGVLARLLWPIPAG